jgi:uncharacterized protein YukE
MTKKASQVIEETVTAQGVLDSLEATPAVEPSDHWIRQTAVQFALDHHRVNGGMQTVPQLLENAKQFHAYITGETK